MFVLETDGKRQTGSKTQTYSLLICNNSPWHSKHTFAKDRCCTIMHNCSFYLRVQLLTPPVPGSMQNSEVLIMSPCLKSRLSLGHVFWKWAMNTYLRRCLGKMTKRHIALWRFTGDIQKHPHPVKVCTGDLTVCTGDCTLTFSSGPARTNSKDPLLFSSKSFYLRSSKQNQRNLHVFCLIRGSQDLCRNSSHP